MHPKDLKPGHTITDNVALAPPPPVCVAPCVGIEAETKKAHAMLRISTDGLWVPGVRYYLNPNSARELAARLLQVAEAAERMVHDYE